MIFNKAYIDKMVDDHKATVDKLNKADTGYCKFRYSNT